MKSSLFTSGCGVGNVVKNRVRRAGLMMGDAILSKVSYDGDDDDDDDYDIWSIRLAPHFGGKYSFAVTQANVGNQMVGHASQVEVGQLATFAGVYDDGNNGCDQLATFSGVYDDGNNGCKSYNHAACTVRANLVRHLIDDVANNNRMSEEAIRAAIMKTENNYINLMKLECKLGNPLAVARGTCCLVGVVWRNKLYVANLGHSRAIICYTNGQLNKIVAEQLSEDHDVNNPQARSQFLARFPEVEDKSTLVSYEQGCWRIKNQIQVSRAIGYGYLKREDLQIHVQDDKRFNIPERIVRPLLLAEPAVHVREIQPDDKFLILASNGLWAHLTNDEVARIVHTNPPAGIAKRLVKEAKKRARGMNYEQVMKAGEPKTQLNDDISVVVLFFNHKLLNEDQTWKDILPHSRKSWNDDPPSESEFSRLMGRCDEWPHAE